MTSLSLLAGMTEIVKGLATPANYICTNRLSTANIAISIKGFDTSCQPLLVSFVQESKVISGNDIKAAFFSRSDDICPQLGRTNLSKQYIQALYNL